MAEKRLCEMQCPGEFMNGQARGQFMYEKTWCRIFMNGQPSPSHYLFEIDSVHALWSHTFSSNGPSLA